MSVAEDLDEFANIVRPKTRADCKDGPRPCPWASCQYSLLIDIRSIGRRGTVVEVREVDDGEPTCALDAADDGGMSTRQVAELMGLSWRGTRDIEEVALVKLGQDLEGCGDE